MTDQYITNTISALVGGLLAILGSVIANYLTHKETKVTMKRKEIRDTIEKIYSKTQQIRNSLMAYNLIDENVKENEPMNTENNLEEISMLINLYVPELKATFQRYYEEVVKCLAKLIKYKYKRVGKLEYIELIDDHLSSEYLEFQKSMAELLKQNGYN